MAVIWDAYDKNFNKINNVTLVRGEPIPDGIFHLVCEIIVKHIDGSYLLMQRDLRKHLGGKWELTAGGSALKDETPLECAIRELHEETGIKIDNLLEIQRIVHKNHQSLYVEYLCITDLDKDAIVLQDGETIAYKWVDEHSILEMDVSSLASSRTLAWVKQLALSNQ